MMKTRNGREREGGFTLIEMIVVLLIIGVLASIGVPRYFKSVELSRTAEAQGILKAVYESEQRYMARSGNYGSALTDLDLDMPTLKFFSDPVITNTASSLNVNITRSGTAPAIAGFGTSYFLQMCNNGALRANNATLSSQLGFTAGACP